MEKDYSVISDKYNGFITKNNNYVWAGAMCLAWNELKNSIIKSPIRLATNNQQIQRVIDNFNAQHFTDKNLDPKCVYVKSGYGKQTLDLINAELKQKFPQKTIPPLNIDMRDDSIISYAYFLKKLSFQVIFERLQDKTFLFNNQHQVHAFYAEKKSQRKQVCFCEYDSENNFTIAIKSKNPKDFLFCVKSQYQLTVQQVFKKCDEYKLKQIGQKDQFMMPVIELNLEHKYNELKLPVLNENFKQYRIEEMLENIKLKIDESGAKVENEAVIMMNRCLMIVEVKQFILDKPFWIVMKENGNHPYLAAYIRNPIQI